jgi:hypothetical protein
MPWQVGGAIGMWVRVPGSGTEFDKRHLGVVFAVVLGYKTTRLG